MTPFCGGATRARMHIHTAQRSETGGPGDALRRSPFANSGLHRNFAIEPCLPPRSLISRLSCLCLRATHRLGLGARSPSVYATWVCSVFRAVPPRLNVRQGVLPPRQATYSRAFLPTGFACMAPPPYSRALSESHADRSPTRFTPRGSTDTLRRSVLSTNCRCLKSAGLEEGIRTAVEGIRRAVGDRGYAKARLAGAEDGRKEVRGMHDMQSGIQIL
ncbi:hypothetical protein C8R46DRAFT_617104 [Mycena filopes]|nr:hypothetical protein C8R46DRAFT_617104 [Mycena filopes]